MSRIDIVEAIEHLPEEFITREMAMAAAEKHNPRLIDILPAEMLTPEIIDTVFSGNLHWSGFDLSKIPERYRTEPICLKAVEKNSNNLRHVPETIVSPEMVVKALKEDKHLDLWAIVPERIWTPGIVYAVLKKDGVYRYDNDRERVSIDRILQVKLSCVPEKVKNHNFWLGLLKREVIPAQILCKIIPAKYKDRKFYTHLAQKRFELIPEDKLCYDLFLSAFSPDSSANTYRILNNELYKSRLHQVMDDRLADTIIKHGFSNFNDLPDEFQTEERLLLAIVVFKGMNDRVYSLESLVRVKEELLTRRVCEELIKANNHYVPEMPQAYWDSEMVAFCLEHTTHYRWFRQMPKKFQTRKMTVDAVNDSRYNLEYARKEFINGELAEKLFRESRKNNDNLHKQLPNKFFQAFTRKTGLHADFFGGYVSFAELKAKHENFTYCRIGDMYVGVYNEDHWWRYDADRVVVTKVTDGETTTVADASLGTLHKTWLEKLIAEKAPSFVKPQVDKSLKDVQGASYYGVEYIRTEDDTEFYRNTFYGQTAGYCARRDGVTYHGDSEENALNGLNEKIRKATEPDDDSRNGGDKVLTAAGLHQRFGFCYLGMGIFAEEYGLDINRSYTVGELRQIIKVLGRKPSLSRFRKELTRIDLI